MRTRLKFGDTVSMEEVLPKGLRRGGVGPNPPDESLPPTSPDTRKKNGFWETSFLRSSSWTLMGGNGPDFQVDPFRG